MSNWVHGQPFSNPYVHGGLLPTHGGRGPPVHGSPNLELVSNGDFSNGTTGWAAEGGGALSIVAGKLRVTGDGTPSGSTRDITGLTIGRTYRFRADQSSPTNHARIVLSGADSTIVVAPSQPNFTFVAASTTLTIKPQVNNGSDWGILGSYGEFDNISLQPV